MYLNRALQVLKFAQWFCKDFMAYSNVSRELSNTKASWRAGHLSGETGAAYLLEVGILEKMAFLALEFQLIHINGCKALLCFPAQPLEWGKIS